MNDGPPLKFHYSNPKFAGKPWPADAQPKTKPKKRGRWKNHKKNKKPQKKPVNLNETKCKERLDLFWYHWDKLHDSFARCTALRNMTVQKWGRVDNSLRLSLRKEFRKRWYKLLANIDPQCGVCGNMPWREKHHIIPLYLGGINENINLIAICQDCHDEIHPWMKTQVAGCA